MRGMKRSTGRTQTRSPKGDQGVRSLIRKDMKRRTATDDWSRAKKDPQNPNYI